MAAVHAEVNHGRWIARCLWCFGAEALYVPGAPEFRGGQSETFLCAGCLNAAVDGEPQPIVWPEPSLLAEIRRLLGDPARDAQFPDHHRHRNWLPGAAFVRPHGWVGPAETLAQLEMENRIQGDVPVIGGPQVVRL